MGRLLGNGTIDRVVTLPHDPDVLRAISRRWFGLETPEPFSLKGEPTLATLYGFDQCATDLVLQVDSDVMVHRSDRTDHLSRMVKLLRTRRDVVAVSPPPPLLAEQPYTGAGPEREVARGGSLLTHRSRETRTTASPSQPPRGRPPELSWHRSLDARLAESSAVALRGGSADFSMIHVPNSAKRDHNRWFNSLKGAERGNVARAQVGRIDLEGALSEWLGARNEDLVFVVRGRNVTAAQTRSVPRVVGNAGESGVRDTLH